MSLRDLVAADCAEPNPLARFVQGFSNDKVGINQDQWVDQRDSTSEGGPSMTAFERLKMMEQLEQEKREGARFRNMEREREREPMYDPLEDDALESSYRAAFQGPQRDGALSHFLKSFVNAGHTKEMLGRGLPDLGLSMHEKAQIRDRAGVMSRHFYSNETGGFIEGQMGSLMENLRIRPEERFAEQGPEWRQPNFDHRRMPPPFPSAMERRRGAEWANEFAQERGNKWAQEFEHDQTNGWANEFASERAVNRAHEMDEYDYYLRDTQETKAWIEENSHHGPLMSGADAWSREFTNQGAAPSSWAEEYERDHYDDAMEKAWEDGASEESKMEEAWGKAADHTSQKSLRELTDTITKIDDPKLQQSSFMQFMRKINRGQVSFADNQVIEHETDNADGWASEYQGLEKHFMDNDWAKEYDDFRTTVGGDWARDYESFTGTVDPAKLQEYEFALNQASNPYSDLSDSFEQGVDLFNQGMITESILALEAAVNQNPENSKAWQYLGQAHAENDKDNQAITCLVKAVDVDPQNLEALAALAVSYTNDFNREKALETLEIWMKRHPEYSHIPASTPAPPVMENDFYLDAWARHTYVANMYLEAARQHPEDPDPEVQTSLGLLYNLSYEYDKAVDCFKAALTKRPTDYLLWNKLGATMANSNRSEEALGAYYRALEGKPTYVRARANLGISFLALNEYPEAANSFLSALRLHPNASHLWDNLKMVFRLMGREDLEERAMNHNIDDFTEDLQVDRH